MSSDLLRDPALFLVILLVFGLAPGLVLRLVVKAYPKGHPRRQELIAELYALDGARYFERPLFVVQNIELAFSEGLPSRWRAGRETWESSPTAVRFDDWRRHYLPLPDEVVNEYLGEDEYVIHADHPSFRAFLIKNAMQVLGLGAVGFLFLVLALGSLDWWALAAFAAFLSILFLMALRRLTDRYVSYVITNLRLIRLSGILGRKMASVPLSRMSRVGYLQKPLGRVLGYATIFIETANEESGLREFSDINDPVTFHALLLEIVGAERPAGPSSNERRSEPASWRTVRAALRRELLPLPDEVIEGCLAEDERVVHSQHPPFRPVFIATSIRVGLLMVAVPLAMVLLGATLSLTASVSLVVDAVVLVLAARWLDDQYVSYVITDQRLIRQSGILRDNWCSVRGSALTDVALLPDSGGHRPGAACVSIGSAPRSSRLRRIRNLTDPGTFHSHLIELAARGELTDRNSERWRQVEDETLRLAPRAGIPRHMASWFRRQHREFGRTFALLVATVLVAGLLFEHADDRHVMVPAATAQARCGQADDCFNSWAYATDVALPIVDLGEDHAWQPAETPQFGTMWINLRQVVAIIGGALTGLLAWKLAQALMTAARRCSRRLVARLA